MTTALTLEELLAWSDDSTRKWFDFFASTPAALQLPSGIYGTANLLGLVHHIVAVELRHSQRLAGLLATSYDEIPSDSLAKLKRLHDEGMDRIRELLADPAQNWSTQLEFVTLSAGAMKSSRRKLLAHLLLHSIRHWAQVAALTRAAGFNAGIDGDLLMSSVID